MAYATPDDFQAYMGATVVIPDDTQRLLERASELVDSCMLHTPDVTTHAATLRQACCMQVELWLHTTESHAITGASGMQKIGDLEFRAPNQLAPRAQRVLLRAGLLYRGLP